MFSFVRSSSYIVMSSDVLLSILMLASSSRALFPSRAAPARVLWQGFAPSRPRSPTPPHHRQWQTHTITRTAASFTTPIAAATLSTIIIAAATIAANTLDDKGDPVPTG